MGVVGPAAVALNEVALGHSYFIMKGVPPHPLAVKMVA